MTFFQFESVLVGDRSDLIPVGAISAEVGCEDGFCVGSDHGNDLCGIDLVGVGFNVDEDGNDS